jgi:hypothetical protein
MSFQNKNSHGWGNKMQNGYQNSGVNQLARGWIVHLVFHLRYASKSEDASHQNRVLLHNLFETNYESNLGPQAELNPSSLLGTCESGMALSCMSEEVQFAIQQYVHDNVPTGKNMYGIMELF